MEISSRIDFPRNKVVEVINTTQAFIDKFNRIPRTFPYKKVKLEPYLEEALGKIFSLKEIATFEIAKDYYVTVFLTESPNHYLEVSWRLSEGKIDILDKKTQEGIPILKTTYSKSCNDTIDNMGIHYEVKGGAIYYEIPIQINSVTYVEGSIYHTYDWTTTYVYFGTLLVSEVKAVGDFYWIYGVEVWVYPDCDFQTYWGWMRCYLQCQPYEQHTKLCYVKAEGKTSAIQNPLLDIYLNVIAFAQVGHDCWGTEFHSGDVTASYISFGPCG